MVGFRFPSAHRRHATRYGSGLSRARKLKEYDYHSLEDEIQTTVVVPVEVPTR